MRDRGVMGPGPASTPYCANTLICYSRQLTVRQLIHLLVQRLVSDLEQCIRNIGWLQDVYTSETEGPGGGGNVTESGEQPHRYSSDLRLTVTSG